MATSTGAAGSRFVVDLGGLKLPDLWEKQLEAEIRALVLRILAELDEGGRSRLAKSTISHFPDGTMGLIFSPHNGTLFPWGSSGGSLPGGSLPGGFPGGSQPQRDSLDAADHTNIVKAVMEHAVEVVKNMEPSERTSNPSPTAVLSAALRVEGIDPGVKGRMRIVLDTLPILEDAQRSVSPEVRRAIADVQRETSRRPIDEQIDALRQSRSRYRGQDGLSEGLDFAAQILEAGRDSIYADDFPFNSMLDRSRRGRASRKVKDDIKDADTAGGIAGGAVGAFAAGIGAGPGAAVSAAGASAGYAVGSFISWLFFD